jgi:hypothetical protein
VILKSNIARSDTLATTSSRCPFLLVLDLSASNMQKNKYELKGIAVTAMHLSTACGGYG